MTNSEREKLERRKIELQEQRKQIEPTDQHGLLVVNAKIELLDELLKANIFIIKQPCVR